MGKVFNFGSLMGKVFASRGKERLGCPAFLTRGTSSILDLPKRYCCL